MRGGVVAGDDARKTYYSFGDLQKQRRCSMRETDGTTYS